MVQQGQVFQLTRCGRGGERLWAYRYRTGGRDSQRVQRGGFASEQDARDALERELERLRRERRISRSLPLAELVEVYLAQHDVQPVTIEKLRYPVCLSPRRPGCGRRSGSRSRNVTSTARSASSVSAAPSPAANSRSRR